MKLTKSQLRGYGLRIDGGIDEDTLDTAIENAELLIIKEAVGDAAFDEIMQWQDTDPFITGGVYEHDGVRHYLLGYNRLAAYIAFGCLLCLNEVHTTVFGTSVEKNDEYSTHRDPVQQARRFFADGLTELQNIARLKGWSYTAPQLPTYQVK